MKKTNYFIIISCIFLTFLVVYYGGRMIYYRNLSKKLQKVGEVTLQDIIHNKSYDSSIEIDGDNLYYKGEVLNNYVYYSNRYFRIWGVEEDQVILVDDISTMLPFSGEFKNSEIDTWLNTVYLSSLSKYDKYLNPIKTCLDKECSHSTESTIGLISLKQFEKANQHGNYLNNKNYYWLSDGSYVNKEGNVIENDEGLYGVRAMIKLKKDTAYFGGTGTYYDPYFIHLEDALAFAESQTNTIQVGSYITYSGRVWRVTNIENSIQLVMQDSIGKKSYGKNHITFDSKDHASIAYYLNHDFLNELDKTYLVEEDIFIGPYENSYLDQEKERIQAYVGLPKVGDLFLNDFEDYFLLTNTGNKNTVYKVTSGMLYADSYQSENEIHPVIHIDKNTPVKEGYGTKESPFVVGEQ